MKTLLMMRHAKSSWKSGVQTDHARPLNNRGRRDAPIMAQLLCDRGEVPDHIVSSDSKRTCETLELMLPVFQAAGFEPNVEIESSFYHAPASEWLERLPEIPTDSETAMFLGHNPGAEELVMHFSAQHHLMPTAAIACFRFDVESWSDIESGELVGVYRPKEI